MDILGKVSEVTTDGRIIVKCSETPEIGQFIYDSKGDKIGIIRRVFGPVEGPYASIEMKNKPTEKIRGTNIYTIWGNKNGKSKGRGRRN